MTVVLVGGSPTEGLLGSTVERVLSTLRASVPTVEHPDFEFPILPGKEATRVSQ